MNVTLLMPIARNLGGAEYTFRQLIAHSQSSAVSWQVIFFEEGPLVQEVARLGVKTHVVHTGRLRHLVRFQRSVRKIRRLLKASNSDVVLSWSGKAHIYGGIAAWLNRTKAVWYQQGSPSGPHLTLLDRVATAVPANLILCVSQMAKDAQDQLSPKRQTKVVYSGIELNNSRGDTPSMEEARIKLGLPANIPVIGIVGRLQHWKGIHVVVGAMPGILENHRDTLCIVVGGPHELEPEYEAHLEEKIATLGVGERVRMVGYQEDFRLWMQAMDIVIHASDHEPLGLVVLEAMALGKPLIASDSGGPKEVIDSGENGLLTPYGDSEVLAQAVVFLLDQPETAKQFGVQARGRVKSFSVQTFVSEILGALRSLLVRTS